MNKERTTETREEMFGILPLADQVFDKQKFNPCCPERGSATTPSIKPSTVLFSALENVRSHSMGEEKAIAGWSDRSLGELVDHILKRLHRPLGVCILNLETLLDIVTETHRDEIGGLLHALHEEVASLRCMLLEHFLREEDVLFPWILSGNGNNTGDLVDDMRQQHMNIAAKMKSAMAVASRLPLSTTTCLGQQVLYTTLKRLELEISNHIHVENTLLYPRALGEMGKKHDYRS